MNHSLLQEAIHFHQQNKLDEAEKIYLSLLDKNKEEFNLLFLLGTLNIQKDKFSSAILFLNRAIAINADFPEIYYNLGLAHNALGAFDSALASYDQAIALQPNYPEAFINRGNVLQELKDFDSALASYDQAIALQPNYAEAFNNRGAVYKSIDSDQLALNDFKFAYSLDGTFYKSIYNIGTIFFENGDISNAINYFHLALKINCHYFDANWNLSLCYLLLGNYKNGWELYEWRWKNADSPFFKNKRILPKTLWLGNLSLADKTIYIHHEQGFGDTIQFCRYIPLLCRISKKVIFNVQGSLLELIKSNLGEYCEIISAEPDVNSYDFHCPLLSLPLALGNLSGDFSVKPFFLKADINYISKWSQLIKIKRKFRVGLAWCSTSDFKNDHLRSLNFKQILPFIEENFDSFEFICVQKEIKNTDKELFFSSNKVTYYGDNLDSFSDTAGLLANLDLVITTCTSVAHLSGSLGIPTWLLLSFVPDFRWGLSGSKSVWYPNVVLYRQSIKNNWFTVLHNINQDLKSYLTA